MPWREMYAPAPLLCFAAVGSRARLCAQARTFLGGSAGTAGLEKTRIDMGASARFRNVPYADEESEIMTESDA